MSLDVKNQRSFDAAIFKTMISENKQMERANSKATIFHDQKQSQLCAAFSGVTHSRDVMKKYFMDNFSEDILLEIDNETRLG